VRHYYINKEWMLSVIARRVYRAAAILSLTLYPSYSCLIFLGAGGTASPTLLLAVKRLVLAGIVGTATTIVAMEYFMFGFDDSSAWKKIFWFALMFIPPIGAALYCLAVYSRSGVLKRYWAKRAQEEKLKQERPHAYQEPNPHS
jgi:hypothetical protein